MYLDFLPMAKRVNLHRKGLKRIDVKYGDGKRISNSIKTTFGKIGIELDK